MVFTVPSDLTITGFDDIPEAGRIGLSTIGQPLADKGRVAGEMFLSRSDDRGSRRRLLPTSLEIRATSGPPRERHIP